MQLPLYLEWRLNQPVCKCHWRKRFQFHLWRHVLFLQPHGNWNLHMHYQDLNTVLLFQFFPVRVLFHFSLFQAKIKKWCEIILQTIKISQWNHEQIFPIIQNYCLFFQICVCMIKQRWWAIWKIRLSLSLEKLLCSNFH